MDSLSIFLVGLLIAGAVLLVALLTPPVYAWAGDPRSGRSGARRKATCDYRWLDRTHQSTADEER